MYNVKIYKANSEIIMNDLKKKGVQFDAIITDPPYNLSKKNNFKTMGRAGIDFGEGDKNFDLTKGIKDIDQLVKKNGSIIVFNSGRNLGLIADALEANGFEVKDSVRWVKNNPMPRNLNRRYISDYENFIWAIKKGAKGTFNKPKDVPYLRCEYKCSLTPKSEKKFGSHTTQKPLQLMRDIIKTHTNKGDSIFDPFMGSGTTGVAGVIEDRHFSGVELDGNYFDIAEKRLKEVEHNIDVFKPVIDFHSVGIPTPVAPTILDVDNDGHTNHDGGDTCDECGLCFTECECFALLEQESEGGDY